MKITLILCMFFLSACQGVITPNNATPKINTCVGVTECVDDGCCPNGCDDSDPDCSQSCGDGVVDELETCDGNCPSSCGSGNNCSGERLEGSAANCTAECVFVDITECISNDGCCAPGCDATTDNDCGAVCETDLCQHGDGCCPDGCAPLNDDDCQIDCTDPSSWPADWSAFETQVVQEINNVRARGANCGQFGDYAPTGPLEMNAELQQAARCHSNDMGTNNFFEHAGSNGSSFSERIALAGFQGQPTAENIAAGHATPADTVAGWTSSDGHCRNMMNPDSNRVGIGYVTAAGTDWGRYWTMVTGRE